MTLLRLPSSGRAREREFDLGIGGGHELRPGQEHSDGRNAYQLVLIASPEDAWARRREISPARWPISRRDGWACVGVSVHAVEGEVAAGRLHCEFRGPLGTTRADSNLDRSGRPRLVRIGHPP